jgi:xanthine dehydrogenase YagS FAD-binding subunit
MQPFTLERPRDLVALAALGAHSGRNDADAEPIAGGTDMLQLLKENVRRPTRLVDLLAGVTDLDDRIEAGPDGSLRLGALATMTDTADHPLVRDNFPVVSQALLASASQQVRNVATVAGNLLQRTRCPYFRDVGFAACNKRDPGSGCAALDGDNRGHAILGTSESCIATHASDFAVALVALDARLKIRGAGGERVLTLAGLHRLPGDTPHREAELKAGEAIVAIEVPASAAARRSHYLKVRDRATFEFALVSAAVGLDVEGGQIRDARIAMGGVGTKPWRFPAVEAALRGQKADQASFRAAAAHATEGATPRGHNAFKLELMKRTLVRALETVGDQA